MDRFGGDVDNWEWPSHSGDFALFRIYTGSDGKPATYASTNIPLASNYQLTISVAGIENGKSVLVLGYPSKTRRYTTSAGIKYSMDHTIPYNQSILKSRKKILEEGINRFPGIRHNYRSQLVELSNLEKFYQGQSNMIQALKVAEVKSKQEELLDNWCQKQTDSEAKGPTPAKSLEALFQQMAPLQRYNLFLVDGVFSSDLLLYTYHFSGLYQPLAEKYPREAYESKVEDLKELTATHFDSYHLGIDQLLTAEMMGLFYRSIPLDQQPPVLRKLGRKYQGDFTKWSTSLFKKSIFTDPVKVRKFLDDPKLKTLTKDPAYKYMRQLVEHYFGNVASPMKELHLKLEAKHRSLLEGLMEMYPDSSFYPEANGTLRASVGKVKGYLDLEGNQQPFYTTLSGLVAKTKSGQPHYQTSDRLVALYESRDFAPYGENGDLPTGFITDNDITGGSSGSPVLNEKGQLIGLVSDSNKESLAGDYLYHHNYQRSINIDIRYVLFIIDQFAEADHLIDELILTGFSELPSKESTKKSQFRGVE